MSLWPKILFLTVSFLLFFLCLFILLRYAKGEMKRCREFVIQVAVLSAAFAGLMIVLRENMVLNILISVVYVFAQFGMRWRFSRQDGAEALEK